MRSPRDRQLVLLRRPFAVTAEPGGLVPVALLGGLFALIGGEAGIPLAAAALTGALAGPASLLVHEFGHLRAARKAAGVSPVSVSLIWAGAATRFEGAYTRGRDQARVALAGPLASFALAFAVLPVFYVPMPLGYKNLVLLLVLFNIAVGLVNLIPADPLDGHKLLVALVWCVVGSEADARRLLRRAAIAWLAAEALGAGALLVERPALGATAIAVAGSFSGQKVLVRRARRLTHS
jgi:Zn-dependent protease